jgi:hypothetical protein
VRYDAPGGTWRHAFVAEALEDARVEEELAAAGFGRPAWIDRRRRWLSTMAETSGDADRSPVG